MTQYDIPNLRQFKVFFLSPTNTRGSRIKIVETKRFNADKTKSVILSYDYTIGDTLEQAIKYLSEKDFNIVARASELDNYVLLCDNWGTNYIDLK